MSAWRLRLLLAVIAALMVGLAGASSASAAEPWWHLDVIAAPTNLPPEVEIENAKHEKEKKFEEAEIEVIATNLGDSYVKSGEVVMTDLLSKNLKLVSIEGSTARKKHPHAGEGLMNCPEAEKRQEEEEPIECKYTEHNLAPFEALVMKMIVRVEEPKGTKTTLANIATVEGGGAPAIPAYTKPFTVDEARSPFGVSRFELQPEEEGGGPASTAGSHPFQITSTLNLNLTRENWGLKGFLPSLPALPRDFKFKLPPGLLGNPTAVPRCSEADFSALNEFINHCPADTVIGVAVVHVNEPKALGELTLAVPVFNLKPAFGEPARFGFFAAHAVVFIQTAISPEEEYAAKVTVHNATELAQVLNTVVTLWGNPDSEVHHDARGWQCVEGEQHDEVELPGKHCEGLAEAGETITEKSFLIFPTRCTHEPLQATLEGTSWPVKEHPAGLEIAPLHFNLIEELSGCGSLEFEPSLKVAPDTSVGSTPSGLTTEVEVPQTGTLSEEGLAETAVKETTVTLPQGVLLNPGAATGLQVCAPGEVGVKLGFESEPAITTNEGFTFEPGLPECLLEEGALSKKGAKVGTFTIRTPLLDHEIEGAAYLGSQNTNPFAPPLVLYLIVEDPKDGIRVKLAGSVTPDPATGQLKSTFKNTPEVPFEDLKLHFFGEGRASVTTPGKCGTYTATSEFTPWAEGAASKSPSASFEITSGPGGMSCTPPLPFSPSIQAGPVNPPGGTTQAGAYTSFSVTIARPDGDEAISGLNVTLPKGIAGVLADVTPCPEPQAENGTCEETSLVGHATTVSGLGPEPFTLHGGNVYLTEGYGGGPFGLAVVFSNIEAGPFHVGTVVVRSAIFVDETTAQVTIKSSVPTFVETVPHVKKGIPVQLKETNVETLGTLPSGKPFQFNPTNCAPLSVQALFKGDEGGSFETSTPLQFTGCGGLEFNPGFEAEVEGQGSKPNGVGFKVITTSKGIGVANIERVHVALPIQLPSRLTTIQKACLDKVFEENPDNPKGCEGANIGNARIETPVFKHPLSGPAYLVSHGNASFPDVEFVLRGEGTPGEKATKLILDGKTDIKKGITYSTFESTPDAPFTRFETTLPAGPHSALTTNVPESKRFSLCGETLAMPTEITGQNGVLIQQTTKVKVTGCKPHKVETKLEKALKECHKRYKHSKKKRVACERRARRKYGKKASTHHHGHR